MFCGNCGKDVHSEAVACPSCGVPPRLEKKFCTNCANPTQANQVMCIKCGVALSGGSGLSGEKSRLAAGLLGIFLGELGIHKFYLGYTTEAVIMLTVTLCFIPLGIITCGFGFLVILAMYVIGLIEGIIYLTKTDAEFVATYVTKKKGWF